MSNSLVSSNRWTASRTNRHRLVPLSGPFPLLAMQCTFKYREKCFSHIFCDPKGTETCVNHQMNWNTGIIGLITCHLASVDSAWRLWEFDAAMKWFSIRISDLYCKSTGGFWLIAKILATKTIQIFLSKRTKNVLDEPMLTVAQFSEGKVEEARS